MKEIVKRGATSNITRVFLQDSASTTGAGKTALTSTSSGLIISTIADLEATATTYTSAATNVETITTLGTFAAPTAGKCRFKEVDATNFPGVYEIQIADARFAVANSTQLLISIQCTGVAPVYVEYQVIAVDLLDTVRLGLTAIPNVAQGTTGSISTGNATGQVTVATNTDKTGYSLVTTPPTATAIATQVWQEAIPGSYSLGSAGYIIGNNLNGAVGSVATNVWSVSTRTLTAGTNIVLAKTTNITGFNDITALNVWDILASTVSTTGSIGLQLKTNIDAAVSGRMATFTYTTPPTTTEIADGILARDIGSGTNAGTLNERTVRSALRVLRNKNSISSTTLTVTAENDSSTAWTATLSTDAAALPVTGIDPA